MKNKIRSSNRLKMTLFSLFMFFGFVFAQAQTKTISGTVNGDGLPLPGVAITIKGKTLGTITDFDGNYSIEAIKGDVLVFSYTGFKTKNIVVGEADVINAGLLIEENVLDEVIVVGYGTLEKKELTGSQVSLKSDDINKVQAVSFEEAIQGKASGVLVTTSQGGPGDAAKIQIRGATSINASSAPLYVIDGVEIDGDPIEVGGSDGTGGAQSSPLSLIDPATIESIEILKDANATSIYGSRGANGVIIITTKTGKGVKQKAVVDLEITTGIQTISNHVDLLGAQEYVDYYNDFFPWNPTDRSSVFQQKAFRDDTGQPIALNSVDSNGNPRLQVRDWRNEVFREALIRKYSLSVRKGDGDSWFSGNMSYTNQEGIVTNTDYKRIQASVNVGTNVNKSLQVGVQFNGGRSDRTGIVSAAPDGGSGSTFGVVTNLSLAPPVQGRFDSSRNGESAGGLVRDESGFVTEVNGQQIINPVLQIEQEVNNSFEIFGYTSAYAEFKFNDFLKFRSSISFNFYQNQGRLFWPSTFGYGSLSQGRAALNTFTQKRWQNNNTLTYDRLIADKHKFNVVVGTSVFDSENLIQRTDATGFESDSVNVDDLSTASNVDTDTNRLENGLFGVFGRLNYSFDGRYVISLSARGDKSSRFFPGSTQWGFFPSVGVTWNASEESFLQDSSVISNLRFKGSVGQTGNDKIGVFQSQQTFSSSRLYEWRSFFAAIGAPGVRNGQRDNAFFLTRVSNPDLTWETTTQYDLGLELGVLNNRVLIGADVFRKETKDLLLERPIAGQSGFDFILENSGEVSNEGIELTINTVNIDSGNFKWTSNFNISFIRNEVVSLGKSQRDFLASSNAFSIVGNEFIVREGESLGSIFGFQSDGVYKYEDFSDFDNLNNQERLLLYSQNDDGTLRLFGGDSDDNGFNLKDGVATIGGRSNHRPGLEKIKDVSGPNGVPDGVIDVNDLTIIGDTNPDHFGGLTNNFKYKNFDLSIALNWKYGNDILNKNYFPGTGLNEFRNKIGVVRDRWTPQNNNTNQFSARGQAFNSGLATSSRNVEDGSFLRLQNITIGYYMPKRFIETIGLNNLRFYCAADNLHVWTKYSGYDPDVSVSRGANAGLTQGVDFDAYPKARTFRIGVKGTF